MFRLNDYEHLQTEVERLSEANENLKEELKSAKNDVRALMDTVALLNRKNKELVKRLAEMAFESWLADNEEENAITD